MASKQDQMNCYSLMDEAGLTALLEDEDFDPSRVAVFCEMCSLLSDATEAFKGISELGERTKLMIQCNIADQSCQKTIFSFERQYHLDLRQMRAVLLKMVTLSPSSSPKWFGLALIDVRCMC